LNTVQNYTGFRAPFRPPPPACGAAGRRRSGRGRPGPRRRRRVPGSDLRGYPGPPGRPAGSPGGRSGGEPRLDVVGMRTAPIFGDRLPRTGHVRKPDWLGPPGAREARGVRQA